MSLVYPPDAGFNPIVYDVKPENETKTRSKIQPAIRETEDGLLKASWARTNVIETQAFRLEW